MGSQIEELIFPVTSYRYTNGMSYSFEKRINSSPQHKVGLDAAGKTTILYKLKLGEIVTTIPTIGLF
jgi:hypothetical protein